MSLTTNRFRVSYLSAFVLLALFVAACSGDAIVDVDPGNDEGERIEVINEPGDDQNPDDPNPNENEDDGVASLRLGDPQEPTGGPEYLVTNELIEVNGLTFSRGGGAEGHFSGFHFFFGFANRAVYSGGVGDSVNVGLFVYSLEPFDGAAEAGAVEGAEMHFSIDGYDVLIASRDAENNLSSTPILGDGSRRSLYVRHIDNFTWTTESGRVIYNAIGSASDLKYIVDRDNLEWEFSVERGQITINGNELGTVGGLSQDPFSYFFIYAGPARGGLFVIADEAFGDAEDAGAFEGQELNFSINGYEVEVSSLAPTMLGDGSRRTAWVMHRPGFTMRSPDGSTDGPIFGVTSTLEQILSKNRAGKLAHR